MPRYHVLGRPHQREDEEREREVERDQIGQPQLPRPPVQVIEPQEVPRPVVLDVRAVLHVGRHRWQRRHQPRRRVPERQ